MSDDEGDDMEMGLEEDVEETILADELPGSCHA